MPPQSDPAPGPLHVLVPLDFSADSDAVSPGRPTDTPPPAKLMKPFVIFSHGLALSCWEQRASLGAGRRILEMTSSTGGLSKHDPGKQAALLSHVHLQDPRLRLQRDGPSASLSVTAQDPAWLGGSQERCGEQHSRLLAAHPHQAGRGLGGGTPGWGRATAGIQQTAPPPRTRSSAPEGHRHLDSRHASPTARASASPLTPGLPGT